MYIPQIGDRVKRKCKTDKHLIDVQGTVVSKTRDCRNYIEWDIKASNGQQHSTIQNKYLTIVHKPFTVKCSGCGYEMSLEEYECESKHHISRVCSDCYDKAVLESQNDRNGRK